MPLNKSMGVNLFLGKAETRFTANGADATGRFGVTDATYEETNPIIDLGAYYQKKYADVTVAIDAAYRHHGLKNPIEIRRSDDSANATINDKHGFRIGVRIGYGF
jgi:hypothetical protein